MCGVAFNFVFPSIILHCSCHFPSIIYCWVFCSLKGPYNHLVGKWSTSKKNKKNTTTGFVYCCHVPVPLAQKTHFPLAIWKGVFVHVHIVIFSSNLYTMQTPKALDTYKGGASPNFNTLGQRRERWDQILQDFWWVMDQVCMATNSQQVATKSLGVVTLGLWKCGTKGNLTMHGVGLFHCPVQGPSSKVGGPFGPWKSALRYSPQATIACLSSSTSPPPHNCSLIR